MAKKMFGFHGNPAESGPSCFGGLSMKALLGRLVDGLILSLLKDEAAITYARRRLFSGSQGLSGITTAGYFLPRISILSSVPISATSGFT